MIRQLSYKQRLFFEGLLFLLVGQQLFCLFLLLSLLPSPTGLLNLLSSGFSQIAISQQIESNIENKSTKCIPELFGSLFLRLLLMDEFHENSLILKDITLCFEVKVVIEMSIDFLVFAILLE